MLRAAAAAYLDQTGLPSADRPADLPALVHPTCTSTHSPTVWVDIERYVRWMRDVRR